MPGDKGIRHQRSQRPVMMPVSSPIDDLSRSTSLRSKSCKRLQKRRATSDTSQSCDTATEQSASSMYWSEWAHGALKQIQPLQVHCQGQDESPGDIRLCTGRTLPGQRARWRRERCCTHASPSMGSLKQTCLSHHSPHPMLNVPAPGSLKPLVPYTLRPKP